MTEQDVAEIVGLLARFYSIVDRHGNYRAPPAERRQIQERLAELGVEPRTPLLDDPPPIVA